MWTALAVTVQSISYLWVFVKSCTIANSVSSSQAGRPFAADTCGRIVLDEALPIAIYFINSNCWFVDVRSLFMSVVARYLVTYILDNSPI